MARQTSVSRLIKKVFSGPHKLYSRFVLAVFAFLGLTGGYRLIAPQELIAHIIFAFYGLLVALSIGLMFSIVLVSCECGARTKRKIIAIFLLASIAPCLWAYFDFEEYSNSIVGLVLFAIINAILPIWIHLAFRDDEEGELASNTIGMLALWEAIILFWFICVSWADMAYWD